MYRTGESANVPNPHPNDFFEKVCDLAYDSNACPALQEALVCFDLAGTHIWFEEEEGDRASNVNEDDGCGFGFDYGDGFEADEAYSSLLQLYRNEKTRLIEACSIKRDTNFQGDLVYEIVGDLNTNAEDVMRVQDFSRDRCASRLLEKMLAVVAGKTLEDVFFKCFEGKLAEYCGHSIANFVVQRIVQRSTDAVWKKCVSEMLPSIGSLMTTRRQGVVWRILERSAREMVETATNGGYAGSSTTVTKKKKAKESAPTDFTKARIARRVLLWMGADVDTGEHISIELAQKCVSKLLELHVPTLQVVAAAEGDDDKSHNRDHGDGDKQSRYRRRHPAPAHTKKVTINVPGAQILKQMLRFQQDDDLCETLLRGLLGLPGAMLSALCQDGMGSFCVIEPLLKIDLRFEWAKRRCCALLMPYMVDLACDRTGGYVVEACFVALKECLSFPTENFPTGYHGKEVQRRDDCGRDENALHLAQQLARVLSSSRERLAACKSGQSLLYKLKLDHFRDDPVSWERGIQHATHKKASLQRLFQDIVAPKAKKALEVSTSTATVQGEEGRGKQKRKRPLPVDEPCESEAMVLGDDVQPKSKKKKKKKSLTAPATTAEKSEPVAKIRKSTKEAAVTDAPPKKLKKKRKIVSD